MKKLISLFIILQALSFAHASECTKYLQDMYSKKKEKKMKLGKVELCHFLQLVGLFLCFSGTSQAEPPRSRSKLYFQSGRSRTKRSWVWNQFFVLEEYMGSDPLYVGKVGNLAFQSSKWLLSIPVTGWSVAHLYLVKEFMIFLSLTTVSGGIVRIQLKEWYFCFKS